jgi:hypothetical protein
MSISSVRFGFLCAIVSRRSLTITMCLSQSSCLRLCVGDSALGEYRDVMQINSCLS